MRGGGKSNFGWHGFWGALGLCLVLGGARAQPFGLEEARDRIARLLEEGDEEERIQAAIELRFLGKETARGLVLRALRDESAAVKKEAALSAAEIGLRDALEEIRKWLESEDAELRATAVRVEGRLGDRESFGRLVWALRDGRASVRGEAALAIGLLGLEEGSQILSALLRDPDARVREKAIEALGHLRGREARRALLLRVGEKDPELRKLVFQGLARLLEEEGDGEIASHFIMAALEDPSPEVREIAISALGRARIHDAAPVLSRLVEDGLRGFSDSMGLLQSACAALGRLDHEDAVEALFRALAHDELAPSAEAALRTQHRRRPGFIEAQIAKRLGKESEALDQRLSGLLLQIAPLEGGDELAWALLGAARGLPRGLLLSALGEVLSPSPSLDEGLFWVLSGLEGEGEREAALGALERLEARGVLGRLERLECKRILMKEALGWKEEALRRRAFGLVARFEGGEELARLVVDGSPRIRREALEALAEGPELPPQIWARLGPGLSALLGSPHPIERKSAGILLGRMGGKAEFDALLKSLQEASIDRSLGISVLLAIFQRLPLEEARRLEPWVEQALGSSEEALVSAVASSLVRLGEPAKALREAVARAANRLQREGREPSDTVAFGRAVLATGCRLPFCIKWLREVPEAFWSEDKLPLEAPPFPLASAWSHAWLLQAQRRPLSAEESQALCTIASSRREPALLGNLWLALLKGGAHCEAIDPTLFLKPSRHPSLRIVALEACKHAQGACQGRRFGLALRWCAEGEFDPLLRKACQKEVGEIGPSGALRLPIFDVLLTDPRGLPLRHALVALRFEDGSMLYTQSDRRGRITIRLPEGVGIQGGAPLIEDPMAFGLE
ncbi:MAG: HEAT repeat domain-containing protein [Sandaracinaceae bacterium]|nr:HEAT repeat domain-containing protein [Sandaracinaceae bacterium]